MRTLPAVIALAGLLACSPCQGDKPTAGNGTGQNGAQGKEGQEKGSPGATKEKDPKGDASADAPPTKELPPGVGDKPFVVGADAAKDLEAKAKLPGVAAGHVTFDATCRPRRVAIGEQGTIQFLMLFAGDAVMLDPPPVTFTIERQQGVLHVLGDPTFRPSEPAGLAPGLKGVKAYDNYAIFDVPFAVDPAAQPGTHRLELRIRYELRNGKKGTLVGGFTDQVGADVTVVTLPADATAAAASTGTTSRGGATGAPASVPLPVVQAAEGDDEPVRGVRGNAQELGAPSATSDPSTDAPAPVVGEGGFAPVWILAAALGLVAFVFVARSRR